METEKMGAIMMGGIGIMMALSVAGSMMAAYTPSLDYVCPICGERFATKDALYSHFTTEHPAEPIDIIWE
jgi:hypothetical protein